jgi:5-methylcytosine-specific restriction endonuclease McrA
MLITQEVQIILNNRTIKHYEDLGYIIPRYRSKNNILNVKKGTQIIVKVKDLNKGNRVIINLQCDYCGKEYISTFMDYYNNNINGNIHKDACINCSHLKSAEANQFLYGVDNSQERLEVREKFKNTCIEKYGVSSFMETEEFKCIGEEHWNWQGGITPKNHKIRTSTEYKNWRNQVFDRDNYTYQICDKTGGNLHAHHLDSFAKNENLRLDIDNGITTCDKCHSPKYNGSFHNIYGSHNNTREQFEEFKTNYKQCASL